MWPFSKSAVSLKSEINSYKQLEQLLEESLAAFRTALDSVVQHSPRLQRGSGITDWRKNLRQWRARLEGPPSVDLLRDTSKMVDRELAAWGKSIEQDFDAQEQDTKEAMAAVAVMAEALGANEKTYGVRFRGISKKLRLLSTSNDIAEIRRKLQGEIELLEKYVDEMSTDNESALNRLRDLRKPRAAAPPSGSGLSNPKLIETIRSTVRTEDRVVVVSMRLPAEVHGSQGAPVLARLAEAFETPELTGQLASGLFLAVTRLALPEAAVRLEILEHDLSTKLGVRVETGIFEKAPGMSATELLLRADSRKAAA